MDSVLQRSFAGGELSPALAARADVAKYQSGLRTCRNFVVQRHGGAANRSGTRFIGACKTDSAIVQLVRYTHETPNDSVLIEAGANYLRFYQGGDLVEVVTADLDDYDGGTDYTIGDLVASGGIGYYCTADTTGNAPGPDSDFWYALPADGDASIYELPTPFDDVGLFNYSQSGRTLTLTHRSHPPQELIYVALTRWVIRAIDTSPRVTPPTNLVLTPTSGTRKFGYVVTAAAPDSYEESEASGQAIDLTAEAPTPDAPHVLTWTGVKVPLVTGADAPEYYVYCDPYNNGTYGFIGTATGAATFNNPGIDPDFTITPPLPRVLFAAAGEYPHVSATYQQRRALGQTVNVPDAVYMSRVGFPSNYGIASPLQDDDAITFRVAGNDNHPVHHMVGLKAGLILLTAGGEWVAQGQEGRSMIPNGIAVDQATYAGVKGDVRPAPVGNGIIFVQARGSLVREISFDVQVESLSGKDLTLFAGHLFDGFTIVSLDYAQTPHSIIWCVRSDGTLLGLTYVPEQDVWGWHRHDTDGRFESVCVMPAEGEDHPYFIVERTIGGTSRRYIERLEPRTIIAWNRDSFFLDAGLTYDGSPATTVGGLDHLEGRTVRAVVDGVALPDSFVVTGGAVELPIPGEVIHVGLPIAFAEVETLDLDLQGSSIRDKQKRVASLTLLLEHSARTCMIGPDAANLTTLVPASFEAPDVTDFTGSVELNIVSSFNEQGRVLIRQVDPLPLTVLGVIPNLEMGG